MNASDPSAAAANPGFGQVLSNLAFGPDGIWSSIIPAGAQEIERRFRERVAAKHHDDYLTDIAEHHSVPVMDREIERFLRAIPSGSMVLDVGGCWGWHWRKLTQQRPDVCVVIVDFVRASLHHAKGVLGALIGTQIVLVHADATALPFPDSVFDGIWSVQAFQHIPDFQQACAESYRVLKRNGQFISYSLHATPIIKAAHSLLRKPYHVEGMVKDSYYLSRASSRQQDILSAVFGGPVRARYTECLFHPDVHVSFSGKVGSLIGQLDARLGEWPRVARWLARQCSFQVTKS